MPPVSDPNDEDLVLDALMGVKPKQWDRLWRALEAVRAESEHASTGGGERTEIVDGVEQSVFHVPYPIYSEAANELTSALYAAGLIVPFNWPAWDGLEQARIGAVTGELTPDDAVRLITATVRSERFGDGAISVALDEGSLQGAVERLRRWVHEGQT